jgi:hypothetical protein
METRANHLWVGAVTLVLLAGLAAFIVWIARLGQGDQREYDIFYAQSVSGLANGSQVSFAGVPVGQVSEIALDEGEHWSMIWPKGLISPRFEAKFLSFTGLNSTLSALSNFELAIKLTLKGVEVC